MNRRRQEPHNTFDQLQVQTALNRLISFFSILQEQKYLRQEKTAVFFNQVDAHNVCFSE